MFDSLGSSNYEEGTDSQTGIVTQERVRTKRPDLYLVLLLNDDFTPMDFVVDILTRHFKKSHAQATEIMLRVHHEGRAVCGVYPLELAETKVAAVMDDARKGGHPLQCIYEKEN